MNFYLIAGALLIGSLVAAFLFVRYLYLVFYGEKTMGRVVDVVVRGGRGTSATSRGVVSYEVDEQEYRVENRIGMSGAVPNYQVGQIVGVHFPPGKPESGVIVSIVEFIKWGLLAALTAIALFAALMVLVVAMRRSSGGQTTFTNSQPRCDRLASAMRRQSDFPAAWWVDEESAVKSRAARAPA